VGGAGVDGGERVGDRAGGVVLRVHADPEAGPLDDLGHGPGHAHRQHAAVGVAEHADVRARGERGLQHPQPVVPVVGVTVEEVLAVEEHPPPLADEEADRVGDHGQVLLRRGAQRLVHVPQVGLGDQADHRGLRVPQRQHLRVGRGPGAGLAGGPERDQLRVPELQLGAGPGEELGVLGQRAGPAALDEAHAELVEQPRDGELVADREGHALALGTVAQRGVVDVEGVVEHWTVSPEKKKTPRGCERSARWRSVAGALRDNDHHTVLHAAHLRRPATTWEPRFTFWDNGVIRADRATVSDIGREAACCADSGSDTATGCGTGSRS
jgi:hypothetical protein